MKWPGSFKLTHNPRIDPLPTGGLRLAGQKRLEPVEIILERELCADPLVSLLAELRTQVRIFEQLFQGIRESSNVLFRHQESGDAMLQPIRDSTHIETDNR